MKIVKMNYSRSPWRLLTKEGKEISAQVPFEHPSLGWTWIEQTIAGETKAECTEKALELLERLMIRARNGVAVADWTGVVPPEDANLGCK